MLQREYRGLEFQTTIDKTRIKRDILFSLDFLVVSVAGAAGFFLGCSFISIAEIVYFTSKHLYRRFFQA